MSFSQIMETVKTITGLPAVSSPVAAPQLSDHIQSAKDFASSWLHQESTDFSSGVQQVSSAINNWNNVYLHQLQTFDQDATKKAETKAILQKVASEIAQNQQLFSLLTDKIQSDTSEVASISGNLTGDATKISAKINGDNAAIRSLQQQIASAQAKINDYHSRDWMWAIPVAGWIERGIESLADNISGARAQINSLSAEVGSLNSEAHTLQAIIASVGNWVKAMKLLTRAIGTIGTSVNNINSDIGNILSSIDSFETDTFPVWIQAQVKTLCDQLDTLQSIVTALNNS